MRVWEAYENSLGGVRLRVRECVRVWEGYDESLEGVQLKIWEGKSEFERHTIESFGVYQSLGGL